MMSQVDPESRVRRRRWGFSLRALMVVVAVAGGIMGWQLRRLRIQREAVAQILAAGGDVMFDYQSPEGQPFQLAASPPGPRWLRQFVGDEPFRSPKHVYIQGRGAKGDEPTTATVAAVVDLTGVEHLNFYQSPWTDAQIARLGKLSALKSVTILDAPLTPASLERLVALPRVESLILRFDRETTASAVLPGLAANPRLKTLEILRLKFEGPANLSGLGALSNLESLRIHSAPADEACLEPLLSLPRLIYLDMLPTRISDAGLQRLNRLTKLERLQLDGSEVTDEGLAAVARRPNLHILYLGHPGTPLEPGRVTDRGLSHLAGLNRLSYLTLAGGRITDAGLSTLARLPRLQFLALSGVEATEAGLRNLLVSHQFGSLALSGPGVSDDWTATLAGQTRLESVTLTGPHLTDAAIIGLPALPKLRVFCLPGSSITDEGLTKLAASTLPLSYLDLRGTAVTEAGMARLRSAKPGIEFETGPFVERP